MKTVWRLEIGHNDLIMMNNTTANCLKLPFRNQFAIKHDFGSSLKHDFGSHFVSSQLLRKQNIIVRNAHSSLYMYEYIMAYVCRRKIDHNDLIMR